MTTPQRTLGLRRFSGPGPEMMFSDKTTYGLTRGQPRQRTRPAAADPVIEEQAVETVVEFIQPPEESDVVIEGMETAAPAAETRVLVDGLDDELPDFLRFDRPRSNIR